MAKSKETSIKKRDILILHGMDIDLVDDIKDFLKSLEIESDTVLNLSSERKTQNDRVNFRIKNCGIPLVILSFDESDTSSKRARPNLYDEIARCQTLRPKDTLVLREIKNGIRVELPSNVEGQLVIIEFDRNRLQKLFPHLITEIKSRGFLNQNLTSEFQEKKITGNFLNKFLDQMDEIWEQQFDIASDKIDRNDWFTENKFQVTLDKFFLEYWTVFNAIIREEKSNDELKTISETSLRNSLNYAAEIWETIADAKMKYVEKLRTEKSKDKKFNFQIYDKYYKLADIDIRDGKKRHSGSSIRKITCFRQAIENLNSLIQKVGI